MFEQSILLPNPAKNRWTFAASIFVEVSAVSVLLLVPLIYTERLGLGWIQAQVLPSPPQPPPIRRPVDDRPVPTARSARVFNPYDAPRSVPKNAPAILVDDVAPPQVTNAVYGAAPIGSGVEHAVFLGGGTPLPQPQPKPQPKPVEAVKKVEPPPAGPIKVSLGAQEAKIIRRVIPGYPSLARQARVQGTVKLLGVISTEGRIEHLQVISGHPLLVPAAVDAVKQWTYRPTLLNGQPVEVMAPIDVNFILSN